MQRLDQDQQIFQLRSQKPNINQNNKINIKLKCLKNNNTLSNFCVNKQCQQNNSFVCNNDQCQCNQKHQICEKGHIKVLLKKINQKLVTNVCQLKLEISKIFTDLINQISQFEEKIVKQIDNELKFIQLSNSEKQFYQIFTDNSNKKNHDFNKFNGLRLSNLWTMINFNNKLNNSTTELFDSYLLKIKQYARESLDKIQTTKWSIKQVIDNFNKNKQKQEIKQKIKKQRIEMYLRNIQGQLFLQQSDQIRSSIIKNKQQLSALLNLFDRKVKKLNLIFKASENEFDLEKYYNKCGIQSNTLILCQSTKSKTFGAFTPLQTLAINSKDEYVQDSSKSSFAFSLSNNDKFLLKQHQKAFYRRIDKQCIVFGGCIFVIKNKANVNRNSYFSFDNNVYYNQKYVDNKNKGSYLKLVGEEGKCFTAKQWEVFKVQFC